VFHSFRFFDFELTVSIALLRRVRCLEDNRVVMIFDPKNQGMMLRLNAMLSGAPKLAVELEATPGA
jgi:hypothetical protein